MVKQPIIDEEFKKLIPPPIAEEIEGLKKDIQENGCYEALKVWESENILLDGHHRLEFCTEFSKAYKVDYFDFDSRLDAKIWMIKNQFNRRNLSNYNRSKLALELKCTLEEKAKENKAHGLTAPGRTLPSTLTKAFPIDTRKTIARAAGVSEGTIHKVTLIEEKGTEDELQSLARGETSINAIYKDVNRREKEKTRSAKRKENEEIIQKSGANLKDIIKQNAKFTTIVIDPPWDWGDEGDVDQLGRAKPTYHTLSYDELLELPISKLSDKDSHIYLWITNRSLPKGFALLEKWGFRYITCLTWCKPSFGMGNYFRGSTEQILFGVKGSLPLNRKDVGTWFQSKRGTLGHSSKPEQFYTLVESCSPSPYIDIFARQEREGWLTWGGEL